MVSTQSIVFAGQGSTLSGSVLSLSSTSAIAGRFLEACREALVADLNSLNAAEKKATGNILNHFSSPDSLIELRVQNNPVVQGVTLYVHQVLDFFSWTVVDTEPARNGNSKLSETAGFCSGVLPAVVVSSCPNPESPQFLRLAVSGFRLAFWIGLRSCLFCQRLAGDGWNDLPWSLTIKGLEASEVERLLIAFNQSTQARLPLRISAIMSDRIVSITGEGATLNDFQSDHLPVSLYSRFANIHGYYHGGDALQETLNEVVEDVQRREIQFPSWDSLQVPLRSTADGQYLRTNQSSKSLLEAILHDIFIHPVDWNTTSKALVRAAWKQLDRDTRLHCHILAIGPNSKSLVSGMNSGLGHSRLCIASHTSDIANGPSPDDIAIVGMSVNFPSAKGPTELWEILEKGLNVVEGYGLDPGVVQSGKANKTQIPPSRFKISDYYDVDAKNKNPRKMNVRHGNFLKDPFEFDNNFFHISPREAKSMDPQQRLLLHGALEAFQDAGYAPDSTPSFQRESTGVYVGVATSDYVDNTCDDIDVYYSPGTLRAFLSGRISYAFQLKGPSVVVDTACSSSSVALYQACRALQAGDCTSALAGGVNVISSPDMYLGLSRAHFLSSTGQCKPWDKSADGYCRAEGCGLFVVKKLSSAVAEGDRIYGVIRGIEVNQCGTSKSITHPDSKTQAELFNRLLKKSDIHPNSIGVVEAHGTGTQAGDYAEVNSLQDAFGPTRTSSNPLIVSSLKGNIGHAEAASGAAGLAKLLLMLQKQQIPPQAAYQTLNPSIASIAEHHIVIPTTNTKWIPGSGTPRRGLLNNFGAAGSNAALIVDEYIPSSQRCKPTSQPCHLLNISAKAKNALEKLRQDYCALLKEHRSDSFLTSLCYSANARRQEHDSFRLSVAGQSQGELLRKLQNTMVPSQTTPSKDGLTVFVFSGQGSVYRGMGAELLATAPVFRENVDLCNRILEDLGLPGVDTLIGDDTSTFDTLSPWNQLVISQCACFVLECSLAQLWIAWGLRPDVLVGHSLGEYAALVTSEALSLQDGLLLVARRAELMADLCPEASTGMVACNISSARAEELLSLHEADFEELTIACKNSTHDCVVAGPVGALEQFVSSCKTSGVKAKLLDVPYGFHSATMDPIREPFARLASTVSTHTPKIPIASTYLGRFLAEGDINANYFVNHARQPVEFVYSMEAIQKVAHDKKMIFVEVGPAPITLPMIKTMVKQTEATFLPSLKPKESPWVSITSALSSLFLQRVTINWRQIYAGFSVRFLPNLPCYPLDPSSFVIPYKEKMTARTSKEVHEPSPAYRFLNGSAKVNSHDTVFSTKVSRLKEFIKAHSVAGVPLCPASVYIELALEAFDLASPPKSSLGRFRTLTNLTFGNPLVYSESQDIDIHTELAKDRQSFRVISENGTLHCSGSATLAADNAVLKDFGRRTSYTKRQLDSILFFDTFSSRILYNVVFPRVVTYSGPYLTIKQLSIAASGLEGVGTFKLPHSGRDGFVCPPAFTDTLLHVTGFVANSKINVDEACICVKVERVTVPCGPKDKAMYNREMRVYCGLVECADNFIIGDAYAMDDDGNVLACVEGMHFKRLQLQSFQTHLARALKFTQSQSHQKRIGPGHRPNGLGAEATNGINGINTTNGTNGTNGVSNINGVNGIKDSAAGSSLTPESSISTLYDLLSELCGIASADVDENALLSSMGIDSLLFIELTSAIQERFPHLGLNGSDFASCETVGDIANRLDLVATTSTRPREVPVNLPESPSAPVSKAPSTATFDRMDELFQELCGFSLQDVDEHTSLDSLGVDSLLSIELATVLRQTFGVSLDEGTIPGLNIRALHEAIAIHSSPHSSQKKQKPPMEWNPTANGYHAVPEHESGHVASILGMDSFPTLLQKSHGLNKKNAPLYLFHDGSGLCNVYSRLGELARDVRGIFSPDFADVDQSIDTMEELASRYIDKAGLMDDENIILGGWSFGGVLAYEISRQLCRRGKTCVQGVILIDSPPPVAHEPLPDAVISHLCNQNRTDSPAMRNLWNAVETQFRRNAQLLGAYHPEPAQTSDHQVRCIMVKCKGTFNAEGLCGVSYPWLSDDTFRTQAVDVWEKLVGNIVPTLDVSSNHFDLFSSTNIVETTEQIKVACWKLGTTDADYSG